MSKKPAPKILYSLLLSLVVIAVGGYIFALPRTLFDEPFSATVWSRDGRLMSAKVAPDGQWRFFPTDSVPTKFRVAITTYEDKRFYRHFGVDPLALGRAIRLNVSSGQIASGASTITMQTIRLSRNGRARTFREKIIEMILATRLEFRHSKEKILSLYAAHASFGGNVVGLESAAWYYFGRSADRLSWSESAMLAVLPNAPSLIHIKRNRERLLQKRNDLLERIFLNGDIDSLTCVLAKQEPLPDAPEPMPMQAMYLLGKMREGEFRSTLDYDLQYRVNELARRYNRQYRGNKINNLAIVVMDVRTGEVLSYVGNVYNPEDKNQGTNVDVVRAPRSSGSVLKPILYAAMLDNGTALPTMLFPDVPTYYKDFTPQNFNRTFDGAVPANRVVERSLNVPSVKMLDKYGPENFLALVRNLGFGTINRSADHYGLSLILGGAEITLWDLTSAYMKMAAKLNGAEEIRTPHYNIKDQTVIDSEDILLSRGAIWLMLNSISNVARPEEEGEWQYFTSTKKIGWKTGTSYGNRDAWAIGVTADYAVGVWVGNCSGEGRPLMTGVGYAAPVLFEVFSLLPKGEWFAEQVSDLEPALICPQSGFLASHICPVRDTVMIPRLAAVGEVCPYHQVVNLSEDHKYRVTTACYDPARIVRMPMFILPPAQEWYYRKQHPEYRPLPPLHPGLSGRQAGNNPIDIIYPQPGRVLMIPKSLEGEVQNLVFTAVHRDRNAVLYWHIDDNYVGATSFEHKISVRPVAGEHSLTVIDEHGARKSVAFTCR
ncbi:penicillin-binding protein 1C [uncultured Alistipes sp.]|jgi:penicillin-binding protein 1C|uniref:penicillin-binding protein 1C n=1 Tax=uncultured Alistipes sp. TaxID=538949 RepID=UPI0025FF8BE5|nr:penicillin-binding protein 1C [uncultured Alistipes sp.]